MSYQNWQRWYFYGSSMQVTREKRKWEVMEKRKEKRQRKRDHGHALASAVSTAVECL